MGAMLDGEVRDERTSGDVVVHSDIKDLLAGRVATDSDRCWQFEKVEMDFPTCFLGRNKYTFLIDPVFHPFLLSSLWSTSSKLSQVRVKIPSFFLLILDRCSSRKKWAG